MANRRVSLKGQGAALFFSDYAAETDPPASTAPPGSPTTAEIAPAPTPPPVIDDPPAERPAPRPSAPPDARDTVVSRHPDTLVNEIRKAVRLPGKEAATYRLSAEEKNLVRDIIYTYRRQGVRTSEIEIGRIAVNYIVADYAENGDNSILARVLLALHS